MVKREAATVDLPERTFAFAVRIARLCELLGRKPGVSRVIGYQLIRSGTSIGSNVEEAQASRSRADFVATCAIACREARESHYWLRLIAASDIIPAARLAPLIDEADQLVAILTTIIKKARQSSPRP